MGCGCGKGARAVRRGEAVRPGVGRGKITGLKRTTHPTAMTKPASKADFIEQKTAQKSLGGMSKDRREIERKRRNMILQKLGRL